MNAIAFLAKFVFSLNYSNKDEYEVVDFRLPP